MAYCDPLSYANVGAIPGINLNAVGICFYCPPSANQQHSHSLPYLCVVVIGFEKGILLGTEPCFEDNCSNVNFKVVRTDTLRPSYGFWKFHIHTQESKMFIKFYCKVYL